MSVVNILQKKSRREGGGGGAEFVDRTHQTHIKQQNKTPSIFVMVITVEILSSHQSRKKKKSCNGDT